MPPRAQENGSNVLMMGSSARATTDGLDSLVGRARQIAHEQITERLAVVPGLVETEPTVVVHCVTSAETVGEEQRS